MKIRIGSITHALIARDALHSIGLNVMMHKEVRLRGKGCSYVLIISSAASEAAERCLKDKNIPFAVLYEDTAE